MKDLIMGNYNFTRRFVVRYECWSSRLRKEKLKENAKRILSRLFVGKTESVSRRGN
jgi:hypothetical protein